MVIAVYPLDSSNPYIHQMVKILHMAYPDVKIIPLPSFKESLRNKIHIDVVWLNWFENILCTNIFTFLKVLIEKFVLFFLWYLRRVRIITVFHNEYPHDMKYPFWNKLLYNLQLRLSEKIVILSERSKNILIDRFGLKIYSKIVKIPHPRYECRAKKYPENSQKFHVLFFGLLRPYKNIELVIKLASRYPDILFTIAGKPSSYEYGEVLTKLSKNIHNIDLQLGFVSDEKLDKLIDEASILILPYNTKSSLNSGVVYYACSKGINMIIPRIASVEEISPDVNIYDYKYNCNDEHFDCLCLTLEQASKDYYDNYAKFQFEAEHLRQIVYTNNSPDNLARLIHSLNIGIW